MLKTVSAITNPIGALNYKGTWNASTNTPTIVSATGTKGDYYVVSVAGTTTIDGISNWGVGDWIAFNGAAWQRVEGGADLNGVNLSVSGTTTLSGLTASTALALDASKDVVSVTNTGTGNNVLATSPSVTTPSIITSINDTNGNELFNVTATGSAVNEFTVANAATGAGPTLSATGSDTNIDINITPKGTGSVKTATDFIASGAISGNNISSYRGFTAYPNANVATTIFTMPSDGMYIVFFWLNGAADASYTASTQAYKSGSSTRLANTQNGALLTITLSGNDIQATHQVGGFGVTYAIQRLA